MSEARKWAGFERVPRGRLLKQVIDLNGALGVAYERSVGFEKENHIHDRHMLVCARGSSSMNIVADGKRFRADSRHIVWVPRKISHADESITTLYDTPARYPTQALFRASANDAQLRAAERLRLSADCIVAPRSPFLSELIERFCFARLVARRPIDHFEERQLLAESLRTLFKKSSRAVVVDDDSQTIADRALRIIETNLFLPITLEEIAASAGASVSSLLRHFRRAFSKTPYAYIKMRRLDEARHLLASGKHQVGEVALLIGYQDFGAFSKSFHRRFGRPPKEYLP